MNRRLRFQFIADSRFCENPFIEIQELTEKLEFFIKHCPGKQKLWTPGPRRVNFGKSYQYRSDFILEKDRVMKWENLKAGINIIQAPFYKFI